MDRTERPQPRRRNRSRGGADRGGAPGRAGGTGRPAGTDPTRPAETGTRPGLEAHHDGDGAAAAIARALAEVGPRLRRTREQRGVTLAQLAEATGISKSTLSRLETGQRRPSLELLLPIAQAHQVALDELVGAPDVGDPRVPLAPRQVQGRTVVPLTRHAGALQAWKILIPAGEDQPETTVHEGYEWLYVLSGQLRLVLADHDLVLHPGEAAEFDTRLPHWLGSTGAGPVEVLSLFGRQGERMHLRARPRPRHGDG